MKTRVACGAALLFAVGCGGDGGSNDPEGGAADVSHPFDSNGGTDAGARNEAGRGDTGSGDGKAGGDASSGGSLGDVVGSGDSSATDGASGDSGAPTKCFEVFGTGSDETCGFSEISGFACSAGFSAGVCPSSDLVGCCVTDLSSTVGTSITGVCYYSSTLATTAMSACVGTDETWKTTAP